MVFTGGREIFFCKKFVPKKTQNKTSHATNSMLCRLLLIAKVSEFEINKFGPSAIK